jgi:hypothetical protein
MPGLRDVCVCFLEIKKKSFEVTAIAFNQVLTRLNIKA